MVDSYIAQDARGAVLGLTELYMYNKQKTYYDYQTMQRKTNLAKRSGVSRTVYVMAMLSIALRPTRFYLEFKFTWFGHDCFTLISCPF